MTAYLHLTAVPSHISPPSIAMAEMADLATALNKSEVTKKGEESPPDSSAQQTKEASPQASSSSPPASAEKQEEKKSEPRSQRTQRILHLPSPRSQRIPRIHHRQNPNLRILQKRICLNSPLLQKVKVRPRRQHGSLCRMSAKLLGKGGQVRLRDRLSGQESHQGSRAASAGTSHLPESHLLSECIFHLRQRRSHLHSGGSSSGGS